MRVSPGRGSRAGPRPREPRVCEPTVPTPCKTQAPHIAAPTGRGWRHAPAGRHSPVPVGTESSHVSPSVGACRGKRAKNPAPRWAGGSGNGHGETARWCVLVRAHFVCGHVCRNHQLSCTTALQITRTRTRTHLCAPHLVQGTETHTTGSPWDSAIFHSPRPALSRPPLSSETDRPGRDRRAPRIPHSTESYARTHVPTHPRTGPARPAIK